MILRSWRGRTLAADADKYHTFLRSAVLPEMEAHGGRGAYVLRRDGADGTVEFSVLSLWKSMGAVREFAGSEPERAVVPAEALRLLVDYDREVHHYEVVDAPGPVL